MACLEAPAAGLTPELLMALMECESGLDPNAVSKAGAIGLGQLMPFILEEYGHTPEEGFIPSINVNVSARYLGRLLERFRTEQQALEGYNCGPGRVKGDGVPRATTKFAEKILRLKGKLSVRCPPQASSSVDPWMLAAARPTDCRERVLELLTGRRIDVPRWAFETDLPKLSAGDMLCRLECQPELFKSYQDMIDLLESEPEARRLLPGMIGTALEEGGRLDRLLAVTYLGHIVHMERYTGYALSSPARAVLLEVLERRRGVPSLLAGMFLIYHTLAYNDFALRDQVFGLTDEVAGAAGPDMTVRCFLHVARTLDLDLLERSARGGPVVVKHLLGVLPAFTMSASY